MISEKQYWMLSLAAPLLFGAGAALHFETGLVVGPLHVSLIIYAAWFAAFLWRTRRLPSEQFEHAVWLAPLTLSPVVLISFPAMSMLGEQEYYGGEAAVVIEAIVVGVYSSLVTLIIGYVLVSLAWMLKRACRRLRLVPQDS